MTRSPLARTVAAATLVVAASCVLGSTSGPATAAACESSSGVTLIVDPGALGGPPTTACDIGEGQSASDMYADAGVTLTYAQRQPGFVCRVNEAPASEPCINAAPADAYWGLFWSDGKSGTWTYSSIGVMGLKVPAGGAVAFAWQQGTTRRTPGIAAPVHRAPTPTSTPSPSNSPSPTRTPTPTRSGTTQPPGPADNKTPAATHATPAGSGSPSDEATDPAPEDAGATSLSPTSSPGAKGPGAGGDPVASDSTSSTTSSTPGSTSTEPDVDPVAPSAAQAESRRVPTWVSLSILVLLLVAIGISAMAARRRTHP